MVAGDAHALRRDRAAAQLLHRPRAAGVAEVVARLLAVQAQDLRAARLALRARTTGLAAADVDAALTEERSVVVAWLGRGTLHLVGRDDYPWLLGLTAPTRLATSRRRLGQEGVAPDDAQRAVKIMILQPQAFHAQPAPPPVATVVRGHTAQGNRIGMSFDRPGHPIAFDTRISGRCVNPGRRGRTWNWNWGWRQVDGGLAPFRRAGSTVRVGWIDDRTFDDGVFGQVVFSMRATVAPGRKAARGWVRMVATFYYARGPTTCDSGRVPFAVGATSARPS